MNNNLSRTFSAGRYALSLGKRTLVMGIVNVTPDSFSDGGLAFDPDRAIARGIRLVEEGADILDIGGESTRPGSEPVDEPEELRRILPVIKDLSKQVSVPISVDTYKSRVAERAIEAGASIINDISAGNFDSRMPEVISHSNVGVILMHIQGTPRNMQQDPHYENVVTEVRTFLSQAVNRFIESGVQRNSILVDPGIGFGKNLQHNLTLIRNLGEFHGIATGILLGTSRKSFIGALTGKGISDRLEGTIASVVAGSYFGADIIRVHDVASTIAALQVSDAIKNA